MGLLDILKTMPLGGCFIVICPKCGKTNYIPKGDMICWISFRQYAECQKKGRGEYPKCHECGSELIN